MSPVRDAHKGNPLSKRPLELRHSHSRSRQRLRRLLLSSGRVLHRRNNRHLWRLGDPHQHLHLSISSAIKPALALLPQEVGECRKTSPSSRSSTLDRPSPTRSGDITTSSNRKVDPAEGQGDSPQAIEGLVFLRFLPRPSPAGFRHRWRLRGREAGWWIDLRAWTTNQRSRCIHIHASGAVYTRNCTWVHPTRGCLSPGTRKKWTGVEEFLLYMGCCRGRTSFGYWAEKVPSCLSY